MADPLSAIMWVIPLVVTAGGTLAGYILAKSTENVSWFGSAQEMCESDNVVGPSFVNEQEGKYCDMVNRVILPICSDDITHDCLLIEDKDDGEQEFRVIGPKPEVSKGDDLNLIALPDKPVVKTYKNVIRMRVPPN